MKFSRSDFEMQRFEILPPQPASPVSVGVLDVGGRELRIRLHRCLNHLDGTQHHGTLQGGVRGLECIEHLVLAGDRGAARDMGGR